MKKPTAVGDESTMVDPSLLHLKLPPRQLRVHIGRTNRDTADVDGGVWRKGSGEPGHTMREQLSAACPSSSD